MDRQTVFDYIKRKYGTEPEYPWRKNPDHAVFRHKDNGKWFALEAGISGDKVGAPVSAVLYKCRVLETDIPYEHENKYITIKALMRIRLLKRYAPDRFTFETLKEEYGIYAVRGPRGIPNSLSAALRK